MPAQRLIFIAAIVLSVGYVWLRGGFVGLHEGDHAMVASPVVQQGYQDNGRRAPVSRRMIWDLNDLEPRLYAYDKASGRLLAEIPLPANAGGAPMTYMAGGKQYVAFSIGGATIPEEVIALTLP